MAIPLHNLEPSLLTSRDDRRKWLFLAVALFMVVATNYLLNNVDRFYVVKEQLLQNNQFSAGNTHWMENGGNPAAFEDGLLRLRNQPGGYHSVYQNIRIGSDGFYQLDFKAGVRQVVSGEEQWENANVAVIYRNRQGERTGSRILLNLEGSQLPKLFSEKFLLKDNIHSVDIAFRLYKSGGEFTIANLSMFRLQEFALYKSVKAILIFAWLVLLAITSLFMLNVIGKIHLVVVAVFGAIVLVAVLMPEEILTNLMLRIETVLPQLILNGSRNVLTHLYGGEGSINSSTAISKTGHFVVFVGLGLLAGLSTHKIGFVFAAASVFVFALVTEVLQLLVDGRTALVSDLIVDSVGAALGFSIGAIWLWCFSNWMKLYRKNSPDKHLEVNPQLKMRKELKSRYLE